MARSLLLASLAFFFGCASPTDTTSDDATFLGNDQLDGVPWQSDDTLYIYTGVFVVDFTSDPCQFESLGGTYRPAEDLSVDAGMSIFEVAGDGDEYWGAKFYGVLGDVASFPDGSTLQVYISADPDWSNPDFKYGFDPNAPYWDDDTRAECEQITCDADGTNCDVVD